MSNDLLDLIEAQGQENSPEQVLDKVQSAYYPSWATGKFLLDALAKAGYKVVESDGA